MACVAWSAPSHYLNQCYTVVNWTLRNKLQWNLNPNSDTFIDENALERVVCEITSILSRPQCVKCRCDGCGCPGKIYTPSHQEPWCRLDGNYLRNCIDGLVQDCCNSIANALGLLQSSTEPQISHFVIHKKPWRGVRRSGNRWFLC